MYVGSHEIARQPAKRRDSDRDMRTPIELVRCINPPNT